MRAFAAQVGYDGRMGDWIVVTRPHIEAERLCAWLERHGVAAWAEPLLVIEPLASQRGRLGDLAASASGVWWAMTSRHGVDALASATPRRDLLLVTAGAKTAAAAYDAGFSEVVDAAAAMGMLPGAEAVAAYLRHGALGGRVIYPCAEIVAHPLEDLVGEQISVEIVPCYRAALVDDFSDPMRQRWEEMRGVMLYSPRTAGHYVALARRAGLSLAGQRAYVLSEAIGRRVSGAGFADIVCPFGVDSEALHAKVIADYPGVRSG